MKDVAGGCARFRPLALSLIERYKRKFAALDRSEIESAIMLALYQSVVRYDPSLGSFRTLFELRALGAVRDAAREADQLTRTDRAHLTRGESRSDGSTVVAVRTRSLDSSERWDNGEHRPLGYHDFVGGPDADLEALLGTGESSIDIETLMANLPERERLAIYLYYWEDLTQGQAGEIMGVGPSRICQLCEKALERMRQQLGVPAKDSRRRSARPGKLVA